MNTLSRIVGTLVVLAAFSLVSCGGGGGDAPGDVTGGGPVTGGSSTLDGEFVADRPNPNVLEVTTRQEAADGPFVTLQVNVTAVENVYSASFDLNYDPALVEFHGWTAGNLLEQDNNNPLYAIGTTSGRVSVGITRSGPVSGAHVFASRTLIRMTFRVLREGTSRIDFANASLLDSEPPAPSAIAGLGWHGGQIDGRPAAD